MSTSIIMIIRMITSMSTIMNINMSMSMNMSMNIITSTITTILMSTRTAMSIITITRPFRTSKGSSAACPCPTG